LRANREKKRDVQFFHEESVAEPRLVVRFACHPAVVLVDAGPIQPVRDDRVEARARPVVQQLHVFVDHLIIQPHLRFEASKAPSGEVDVAVVGQLLIQVAGSQRGEDLGQLGV